MKFAHLSSVQAVIDNDEFKETVSNINKIQKDSLPYTGIIQSGSKG